MNTAAEGARTLGIHDRSVHAPFGDGQFRSRFTDGVWQGPTWSFAILFAVLQLSGDQAGPGRWFFFAGFGVVMLMTVAALRVRWERLPLGAQAVLPAGDLVGAGLMAVADPSGGAGVILLCSLPVVWLAFEFGLPGLVAGGATTVVIGVGAVLGQPVDEPLFRSSGAVLTTLFVIGLGVVARLMSGILRRVGQTLLAQTEEVETSRRQSAEGLALMDGVMESIDIGVVVLRADDEPVLNSQAQAMVERMGMSAAELDRGGEWVFSDGALSATPVAQQVVSRALAGEEFAGVVQWVGELGDQRVVIVSARQLVRPGGERWATVLAMWDATELVDAIEVREAFLTTVSHELRTPLTAIIASMELLTADVEQADRSTGDAGAESRRLLGAISRNTTLLRARIDELITSAESDDVPVRPTRTDVTALVRAALTKHDPHVAAASVTLEHEVPPELTAELDPLLFEQVVDNLVSNAVKYTGAGGRVAVLLREDQQNLVLSVVDTGSGMSFDEQRQVFDRFYRAPRARASAVQGLGIGLSLVRSIVERHHGNIDLRSALGEGTTVTVTLPVAAPR